MAACLRLASTNLKGRRRWTKPPKADWAKILRQHRTILPFLLYAADLGGTDYCDKQQGASKQALLRYVAPESAPF